MCYWIELKLHYWSTRNQINHFSSLKSQEQSAFWRCILIENRRSFVIYFSIRKALPCAHYSFHVLYTPVSRSLWDVKNATYLSCCYSCKANFCIVRPANICMLILPKPLSLRKICST